VSRRAPGVARRQRASGFGLIEVLLVIIIIGILTAIAVPMYLGQRERAKNAVVGEGGRAIAVALLSVVTESAADDPWPMHCDQATLAAYLPASEWPNDPFSGLPMSPVAGPSDGDCKYEAVPGGQKHRLRVYLHATAPFLTP
jgi:prepilin-type N-terminal cleavage/methylation domain-containing protein